MGIQADYQRFALEEQLGLIEVTTNSTFIQLLNLQIERLQLSLQELQTGGDATKFMLNYHQVKVELDVYLELRKFINNSKDYILTQIQGDAHVTI